MWSELNLDTSSYCIKDFGDTSKVIPLNVDKKLYFLILQESPRGFRNTRFSNI